ncbi:hypothetical protein ABID55_002126 [Staphylococcus pasteuri]|nr:hypothetical protein I6I26_04340 [Staphylococcus pasteuri]
MKELYFFPAVVKVIGYSGSETVDKLCHPSTPVTTVSLSVLLGKFPPVTCSKLPFRSSVFISFLFNGSLLLSLLIG